MQTKPGESKKFVGVRSRGDARVWVQTRSAMFPLPPHNDIRNHSPDGFEWGYGGSGPAQLALAICLEVLDGQEDAEEKALLFYQDVKWRFVGRLEGDVWELDGADVRAYLLELEQRAIARAVAATLEAERALDAAQGQLARENDGARRQGPAPESGE